MTLPDPHSYRDDAQPSVKHLDWQVEVSFTERVLAAVATLDLDRPGPGPLDLDTRDLTIGSVTALGPFGEAAALWELGPADPVRGARLRISLPAGAEAIRIGYRTAPEASALQWMDPAQTTDGTDPFLYSQCQTIHARSMLPIQDTPGVRFTYRAALTVPDGLTALMSATRLGTEAGTTRFEATRSMPAYLLALAVGRLDGKDAGPRSTVWAEPSVLDAAAWEFGEVEDMITTAESVLGPYQWGRADLLVLPPAYPYGGMENPQLIFLTPTLITGDRSLAGLVAHELAHHWTGNLVTAASLEHFWVNEGFTVYAEREISALLSGREITELQAAVGYADLLGDLEYLADRPQFTRLRLDLHGVNPDVSSSYVALEKGYLFLRAIAEATGRDRFNAFLREYLDHFHLTAPTGEQVVAFMRETLGEVVDFDEWLHGTGLPADAPKITSPLLAEIEALGQAAPSTELAAAWHADQWQAYLAGLQAPLPADLLTELDTTHNLTAHPNTEIRRLWLLVALRSGYAPAIPATEHLLATTGRLKFLKPLYDALADVDPTRATRCFAANRNRYHPIAITVLDTRLSALA